MSLASDLPTAPAGSIVGFTGDEIYNVREVVANPGGVGAFVTSVPGERLVAIYKRTVKSQQPNSQGVYLMVENEQVVFVLGQSRDAALKEAQEVATAAMNNAATDRQRADQAGASLRQAEARIVALEKDIERLTLERNRSRADADRLGQELVQSRTALERMAAAIGTINTEEIVGKDLFELLKLNLAVRFVARINKAMLRPGRLDAVICIEPPDEQAVIRLFRRYAQGLLDGEADETLLPAAKVLSGQIPSVVREVVERSKLASIRRTKLEGKKKVELRGTDLLVAANGIMAHIKLLEEPEVDERSDIEKAATIVAAAVVQAGHSTNGKAAPAAAPSKPKQPTA